jgi:hypothetical protein
MSITCLTSAFEFHLVDCVGERVTLRLDDEVDVAGRPQPTEWRTGGRRQ